MSTRASTHWFIFSQTSCWCCCCWTSRPSCGWSSFWSWSSSSWCCWSGCVGWCPDCPSLGLVLLAMGPYGVHDREGALGLLFRIGAMSQLTTTGCCWGPSCCCSWALSWSSCSLAKAIAKKKTIKSFIWQKGQSFDQDLSAGDGDWTFEVSIRFRNK